MALQFIGVTSGSGVSSSSAAISYHGSTASGDLVVVLLHYRNQSLGFTQATGYTALFDNYLTDSGGGSAWRAYYQFSSSTPDDPSSSFAAATDEYMWLCYTFRDADDIATSSSSHSGTFGDGGFNEDPDPPAISPSVANVIQVPSCAFSGNTTPDTPTVWPSGYDVGTRQFIAESILGLAAVHKSASTSDDPSAFEISDLYEWYARTIVVSKSGGTGGPIEGPDSSGGTGAVESTGSGNPTEDQDESSGTGTTESTGTGDPTEGPDVGGGDGGIDIVGSGGPTEGADAPSGVGTSLQNPTGTLDKTESEDAGSASGDVETSGSSSTTESQDEATASGTSSQAGTLDSTEAADDSSSSGEISIPGSAAISEQTDTAVATGGSAVSGSSAITEDVDSPASSGSLTVSGSSSSTEASDDTASSGLSSVSGSASRTEQSDSTTTSGDSTLPGTGSPTEQSDTAFSSGAMLIAGSLALFEASDPTTASGIGQFIGGDLDVTESSDPPEASGDVDAEEPGSVTGFVDFTEGEDDRATAGSVRNNKGTKRCCCPAVAGCTIFRDEFGRADNASLGANWVEYGSDAFEIFNNMVRVDQGGKAICQTVHPTPSGSMAVYLDTVAENEGDVYDLLLNVVDEDNHHLARFTRNDLFDSTIDLILVSGGVETILNSETIQSFTGTARTFSAFIADNEFCASVSFAIVSLVTADTTLIASGYQSGFGSTTEDALIDNFEFSHHLQTKEGCPSCVCQCGTEYVPPCLNIHLEGSGARMGSLSCDFELRWDRANAYWYGTALCCDVDWPFILTCGDGLSWETFGLLPLGFDCTVTNGGNTVRSPVSGSCSPFTLEFGPYIVTDGDLACACGPIFTEGSWTVTITECA